MISACFISLGIYFWPEGLDAGLPVPPKNEPGIYLQPFCSRWSPDLAHFHVSRNQTLIHTLGAYSGCVAAFHWIHLLQHQWSTSTIPNAMFYLRPIRFWYLFETSLSIFFIVDPIKEQNHKCNPCTTNHLKMGHEAKDNLLKELQFKKWLKQE